jgi:hypothetical protein
MFNQVIYLCSQCIKELVKVVTSAGIVTLPTVEKEVPTDAVEHNLKDNDLYKALEPLLDRLDRVAQRLDSLPVSSNNNTDVVPQPTESDDKPAVTPKRTTSKPDPIRGPSDVQSLTDLLGGFTKSP